MVSRSVTFALWLAATVFLAAAAGDVSVTAIPPTMSFTRPAEEAMFDFLTRTDWCDPGCRSGSREWPATCYKLRFLRSGSFRRWSFSDVLENDVSVSWNFRLDDDSTGRLLAGGRSAFAFRRVGEALWFAGRRYEPCARPAGITDRGELGRSNLPDVQAPALLASLCGVRWVKEDDFDLFMTAQTLRFEPDLRCEIGFRDGACRQTGRFSIENDAVILELMPPGCDERGHTNLYAGRTVGAERRGDTLTLDRTLYVPRDRMGSWRRVRGLGDHGDLYLNLTYDGELQVARPKLMRIEFEFVSRDRAVHPMYLGEFRVEMQPHKVAHNGMSPVSDAVRVAQRDYGGRRLAPGTSLRDTVTIVPRFRGDYVCLHFQWACRDTNQDYHPSARPMVRIR